MKNRLGKTCIISLSIRENDKLKLEEICRWEDCSLSSIIRKAIKKYLEENQK